MRLKSVYFIKRFLIVALLAVLMASVGVAPDQPVLFAVLSAVCIVLVRLIWKSAQKDEKAISRRQFRLCSESGKTARSLKQAA